MCRYDLQFNILHDQAIVLKKHKLNTRCKQLLEKRTTKNIYLFYTI